MAISLQGNSEKNRRCHFGCDGGAEFEAGVASVEATGLVANRGAVLLLARHHFSKSSSGKLKPLSKSF